MLIVGVETTGEGRGRSTRAAMARLLRLERAQQRVVAVLAATSLLSLLILVHGAVAASAVVVHHALHHALHHVALDARSQRSTHQPGPTVARTGATLAATAAAARVAAGAARIGVAGAAGATAARSLSSTGSTARTASSAGSAARTSSAAGGAAAKSTGAARSSGAGKVGGGRTAQDSTVEARVKRIEMSHSPVDVEVESEGAGGHGWSIPGEALVEQFSVAAPARVAVVSPFLAGVVADASYLRALAGPFAMLMPVIGLALGIVAAVQTHGVPIPCSVGLFGLIMVLGMFDAWEGLMATLVVAVASLVTGSIFDLHMVASLVLIGALWCGIPIMVSKIRPFAREHPHDLHGWWIRLGDAIIGSALAAYLAYKLIQTAALTAGLNLPIGDYAAQLGWAVFAAAVLRYGVCVATTYFLPDRLAAVTPGELPEQRSHHQWISVVIRAMFATLVFAAFLGTNWVIFVMAGLYVADLVLPSLFEDRSLPSRIYRWVPRNLGKIFVLTVAGVLLSKYCDSMFGADFWKVASALVAILAIALVIDIFGALEGEAPPITWMTRIAGATLVIFTGLQLSGHLIT